jgi:AcrR family transcriptional regulator
VNEEDPGQPRKRLTRAEAKARTRELLLDAAARTFARKGFAGASVEEIAEDAGFTVGALYSHFSSKSELFLELMAGRARDRVSETAQLLAEGPSDDAMWTALGEQMIDVADKDMDLMPLQAEFWLYAVRNPEVMETFTARLRRGREPMERLIGAGLQRAGQYPDDLAPRLAIVVLALFQGMVRQRRLDPDHVSAELYGEALRWLFAGVRVCESGQTP